MVPACWEEPEPISGGGLESDSKTTVQDLSPRGDAIGSQLFRFYRVFPTNRAEVYIRDLSEGDCTAEVPAETQYVRISHLWGGITTHKATKCDENAIECILGGTASPDSTLWKHNARTLCQRLDKKCLPLHSGVTAV